MAILEVLREPSSPVNSLIWVYAVGMLVFMSMNGVLGLYLKNAFGVTESTVGNYYFYLALIGVVMRALLLGPAVRRFGEVGAMRLGALSLTLGIACVPLPSLLHSGHPLRVIALIAVLSFVPVGTALLFPASTALVSGRTRDGETGQMMGVQQAFGGVARLVGPLWSTAVFQINFRYPFWIAAIFMLACSRFVFRLRQDDPSPGDRRETATAVVQNPTPILPR